MNPSKPGRSDSFARVCRWCRREPRLAGMAAGLIALLVASTLLLLALYQRENELLAASLRQRDQERSALFYRINKEWAQEDRAGVRIYPEDLAVLAGRRFNLEGNERKIALGVHSPRRGSNPLQIVHRFALLVNCLTTNLPTLGDAPFVFELYLFKSYSNALAGFRNGDVEVMPLSPASYVEFRGEEPAVMPLVRQSMGGRSGPRVAIFTRSDSNVRQLDEIKGRSLVVGLTGFPFEDWMKAELWSAGLRAADFTSITNLPHNLVISAINARRFDVGVADFKEVSRHIEAGTPLWILREVTTAGYLWVGSKKLDQEAGAAIRDRILAVHDREVLAAIDEELTGFTAITSGQAAGGQRSELESASVADWDAVEEVLRKARLFDGAGQ